MRILITLCLVFLTGCGENSTAARSPTEVKASNVSVDGSDVSEFCYEGVVYIRYGHGIAPKFRPVLSLTGATPVVVECKESK